MYNCLTAYRLNIFKVSLVLIFIVSCNVIKKFAREENIPYKEEEYENGFQNEVSRYGIQNGETILDLGSFTGKFSSIIFKNYPQSHIVLEDLWNVKNHLFDYSFVKNDTIYNYKKNRKYVRGTFKKVPIQSNSFDKILCRRTYHEFRDLNKSFMMAEIKRLLKDNGELIIVEAIPSYLGEIDTGCKSLYLEANTIKHEVIKKGFKFISEDSTTYNLKDSSYRNLSILKFRK